MNVIFLDFDGVLDTIHYKSEEDIERRIKILADVCHEFNAKIVIEASAKIAIDENTMEIEEGAEWVKYLFSLFNKYNIEVIGRTPDVKKYTQNDKSGYLEMWKEDEIRLYLMRHPEIDHYCIIDDDDLASMHRQSDLDKVRNHLVKTLDYSDNPEEEGLLAIHKEQIGEVLKKENKIRKYALMKK
ncbi:MAG: hypothetical protein IKN87_02140 [Bacilli bacterium]|nr:hypothetical protein [Bacilli bacterium]